MRLKQIKLAGFKSFADPTVVRFPSNRCAIVGPNGCGKSNIVDAARWVMGESSARQLRGEALTDVIFNGAATRKLAGLASVELLFDNSDGRIGAEYASYAEIAIRREVSRDSRSSYFLNGAPCRRRDIADVFLGTGVGPRSYAIIEQGMVSTLVEARPEELRGHFEEAAGISRYRQRRRETENRIRDTEENLARLQDIRDELAEQIQRLQRQAKAAERYRELKAAQSQAQAELHAIRSRQLRTELKLVQREVGQKELAFAGQQAGQRRLEAQIEEARAAHAQVQEALQNSEGGYYRLGADINRCEEAIKHHRQRKQELAQELAAAQQRSQETASQLSLDEAEIQDLRRQIDALAPIVAGAQNKDVQASAALESLEDEYRTWQTDWETFSSQAAAQERDVGIHSSRAGHLQETIERLRQRLAKLAEDDAALGPSVGEGMDGAAAEGEALQRQNQALAGELDACLTQLSEAQERLVQDEAHQEAAREQVQQQRDELARLQAAQQAALGRSDADANAWLAAQGLREAERLGQALSVTPGWEHAVEMVLGALLQAVPVANLEDYAGALGNLNGGQVALVEGSAEVDASGELPSLASLARHDSLKLNALLYGVFAAESDEAALAKRNTLGPGQSIITRGGLWLGRDWLRHLPRIEQDNGVIARARDIEAQQVHVLQAEQRLDELQRTLSQGRAQVRTLEDRRETLRGQLADVGAQMGKLKADQDVRKVKLEEALARQARRKRERSEIRQQLRQENAQLAASQTALAAITAARGGEAQAKRTLKATKQRLNAALEKARQEARALHEQYHLHRAEQQGLVSRLQAVETAQGRLASQAAALADSRIRIEEQQTANDAPVPGLQQELQAFIEQRVAAEAELADLRRRQGNKDASIRELEGARAAAQEGLEQARTDLEALRVTREGLQVEERHVLEQVEAQGHSLEALLEVLAEDADEGNWSDRLASLERRLQRLGAINLAAIEELETQSARKAYLDAQHEDLNQALQTLLAAIHKIDRETRTRFKETFEQVNANLGKLFPKVFGGGRAYLEMTGQDLLNTGVSIKAQPPGKRIASINLLSGGEKAMTAIALIFSIFQINPSPVCLLDEVDAPLDDLNVVRFAELIQEMSKEVQFVVVTHNKLTMEMADQLVGVTMGEPGVSHIVSVDVEQAVEMANAAA